MADLHHLADPADWADAVRAGSYDRSTRGASLAEVGYVHCSWAHQVPRVEEAAVTSVEPVRRVDGAWQVG